MSETTPDEAKIDRRPRGPIPDGWVKLETYGSANEAELSAAVLTAEAIPVEIFGANTNSMDWLWQVFNDVDLIVPEKDANRARQILARAYNNDVEPSDLPADQPPPTDKSGQPLVPVAAFDNLINFRDAQTILASERIKTFGPRLTLRGDKPPGQGKRFILHIPEKDLRLAQSLLAEEAEENKDQPRCPRCGAWRVHPQKGFLKGLAGVVGMNLPPETMECHSCHYRGPAAEFLARIDE